MCYNEFIAYQCGHRSMGVVRPCPLTTAGHHFPVCGAPPDKPHYAETMCAACERQLHSRWVLIREWEHRWLHERGVCGCEVTFPGLLTTPRVIGEAAPAGDVTPGASTPEATTPRTVLDDGERWKPKTLTAATEDSIDNEQQETTQGDARVPAIFSEAVTSTGEHRVTVRLSSLYAAEWQADHRALHDAGKCNCKTTFAPFKPQIADDELTPDDRETLLKWREKEETEETKSGTADIADQVDETTKRIADIKKAFGKFEVDEEPPKVKLPPLAKASTPPTEPKAADTRTRGQWRQGQHGRHHNQRFNPPRGGGSPSTTSPPIQPAQPLTPTRGQLILASSFQPPYSPPSPNYGGYPYHYPHPYQPNTPFPQHPSYNYPDPSYPPSHTPTAHYFTPAYPPYTTSSTYTDTIPHGAHPWTASPPPPAGSNMPWMAHGPGPYRTPGFTYPTAGGTRPATPGNEHYGGEGRQQQLLLPPPAIVSGGGEGAGRGQGDGKGLEKGKGKGKGEGTESLPLCGVPIGAGPEGTSHLPPWGKCPLRKDLGALAITMGEGERSGVEGKALRMESESVGGQMDGTDEDGEGRRLFPPTPPRRRHSAAT